MQLFGIDFTSAPRRAKAIVIAGARLEGERMVRVESLQRLTDFAAFEAFLATPGPWIGAFDLPFGLPRELLAEWGWCAPQIGAPVVADAAHEDAPDWATITRRLAAMSRETLIARLRAYCDARPAGRKFAHRRTDGPAGSSPSMKWVNPPVALMLHAGAPRLLAAGVHLPGLYPGGDPQRVALEGYPGMVARSLIGREPYKSDDKARQSAQHRQARARILAALHEQGWGGGPALQVDAPLHAQCLEDPTGDALDALLCLVLAGWAWQRRDRRHGLPEDVDPLEGWVVGA